MVRCLCSLTQNKEGAKKLFNYSKLRGKIYEKYKTAAEFAAALGISASALSYRLSGRTEFTQAEILKSCKLLEIPDEDVVFYFFTLAV